jgi:ATP-dependent RNA helicase RhlB
MGDLPQVKRLKVINDLKAGKTKILVATDVAARGLDIESLAMVVNYDLPAEAENYVHRIGRTARAGKTGKAITLASEQDVYELPAIERYIGKKIPSEIAAPDLYAQDKSAGQPVRTDADEYPRDERRSGHRLHPGAKAGEGRSRPQGRAMGGTSHHGGKRREAAPGSGASGSGISGNGVSGNGKNRRQPETAPHELSQKAPFNETQDLSRLSFDERMALYKQKYNSAKQPEKQAAEKPQQAPEQVSENKGIMSKLLSLFKRQKKLKKEH